MEPTAMTATAMTTTAMTTTATEQQPSDGPLPVRLTQLATGDRGRLHTAELTAGDRDLLSALGLADRSPFRLCKAGNPWIVQVRSTRVGLADAVASRILVIPEPAPAAQTRL